MEYKLDPPPGPSWRPPATPLSICVAPRHVALQRAARSARSSFFAPSSFARAARSRPSITVNIFKIAPWYKEHFYG